jgi:hypothetical protein
VKKQRRSRRDAAGTVGELAAMAPHSSLPLLIGLRSGCQSSRPYHSMAMQRSSTSGSGDHRRAHKYPSTRSSIHVIVLTFMCC